MRTTDEMVLAVHERMNKIQRRQETARISAAGGSCVLLFAAVIALVVRFGGMQHQVLPSAYSGASLLADDVGGYILTALIAFMAGAAIAAVIRAKRRKKPDKEKE